MTTNSLNNVKSYDKTIIVNATTSALELEELKPYSSYCIRVLGYTRKGNGNTSACHKAITAEDGRLE